MQRRASTVASAASLGAAAFLLALAGCAQQAPQEPVPPATQETITQVPRETASPVCASADALTDSLNDFRNTLTPEATPEQIRLARDKVKTSYDSLASDLNSIAQNVGEDLRTQVDRLKATVGGISNGAKVSDAIDSLKSNTDAIGSSLNSLESELKCQH